MTRQRLTPGQHGKILAHRQRPRRRITRAEDVYPAEAIMTQPEPPPLADWAHLLYPPATEGDMSRRGELSDVETHAIINDGRWVARCPFCPSAQVVSETDPRFLCAGSDGCANRAVRGAYVRVVFPPDRMLRSLDRRAERGEHVRSWHPDVPRASG